MLNYRIVLSRRHFDINCYLFTWFLSSISIRSFYIGLCLDLGKTLDLFNFLGLLLTYYCYLGLFIILDLHYYFLVKGNVQEHFYLADLLGIMRSLQENLFDSIDNWHQIVLKHEWVNTPLAFIWWRRSYLHIWVLFVQFSNAMFAWIHKAFRLHWILKAKERLSNHSLVIMFGINIINRSFAWLYVTWRHHLREKWKSCFFLFLIGYWVMFFMILRKMFV